MEQLTIYVVVVFCFFFVQAEDGIRDRSPSRGLGDVYKRQDLEDSIRVVRQKINENKPITDKISSRFLSIKLLEKDEQVTDLLSHYSNFTEIKESTKKEIRKIEIFENEDSETVITDAKYGFITGALKETFRNPHQAKKTRSEKIDNVLTHKHLGFPLFTAILFLMFYVTFKLGAYPMDWIDM